MKEVSLEQLGEGVEQIVPGTLAERVVLTRGGKPVAIVTGVGSLEAEEIDYIRSPDFWKMIAERRKQPRISLDEAFRRLEAREAREASAKKD
jgi:hypothetical protein